MTLYSDSVRRVPRLNTLVLVAGTLSLFGCASVGPDFKQPAPPAVNGYITQSLPAETVTTPATLMGGAQHLMVGQAVPITWWQNFGSAKLDAYIDQALRTSPSLESAQATLRQAQQTYAAQAGS
ncbi:MAG: hypothetical protein ACYCTW_06140, partial [Sulfuricella sp.]